MLPRIGEALINGIRPLASGTRKEVNQRYQSAARQAPKRQPEEKATADDAHQQESPPDPAPGTPPELKLVPTPQAEPPKLIGALRFLELLQLLDIRKHSLIRWIGRRSYQLALRSQKKAARFKRGTLIDVKVE